MMLVRDEMRWDESEGKKRATQVQHEMPCHTDLRDRDEEEDEDNNGADSYFYDSINQ